MRALDTLDRPGRSARSKSRKSLFLIMISTVMLCGMSMPVGAVEHVVTIYFGGTDLLKNDYKANKSPFDSPALVPLLHHCDDADKYANKHRKYIDGLASPASYRNGRKVKRAGEFLNEVMKNLKTGDTVKVNSVGNSRGGVTAIWFASLVADGTWGNPNHDKITRINIIGLDPVPGDKAWKPEFEALGDDIGWNYFRLSKDITNYFGIYGSDERSKLFAPLVPSHDQLWTRYMLIRLRGSHQTHVGSQQAGGHSVVLEILCSSGDKWCGAMKWDEPNLKPIGDIALLAASELLKSPEWGSVQFGDRDDADCPTSAAIMDPDNPPADLINDVDKMNSNEYLNELYYYMRRRAFLPGANPFASYFGSDCQKWGGGTHANFNEPRCVIRVDGHEIPGCSKVSGVDVAVCPLEDQADMPVLGYPKIGPWTPWMNVDNFWNDIYEMGYLPPLTDNDNDGIEDSVDNCPHTFNPLQENTDGVGDHEGDHCDPVADANGPNNDEDDYYEEECTGPSGAQVQLDGSGSHDPNNDIVLYDWFIGPHFSKQQKPLMTLSLGEHTAVLKVEDKHSNTDIDSAKAFVVDTTKPEITCPKNIIAECRSHNGNIEEFEATAVDICHGPLSVSCEPSSGHAFQVGTTTPLCSVTDPSDNTNDCTFDVKIVDTTYPVITGITEPIYRWPPNHKYETFLIEDFVQSVSDICTPLTMDDLRIASVTHTDEDESGGSGNTSEDIVIAPDENSVDLRIERSGKNKPRIYTVNIEVSDGSGNTTTASYEVQVGKKGK